MPTGIPTPPQVPPPPSSGYQAVKASDYGAANLLLQHQKTSVMFRKLFAEIHKEQLGNQAIDATVSLDKDYRAEKINPAHGFVGSLNRGKLNDLEAISKEIADWIANRMSTNPGSAVTWGTLKQDPNTADLVKRIGAVLSDVLKHQEAMCGLGVQYLTSAQRAQCCVEIDNGKLHLRTYEGSTFKALEPITSTAGGVGFGGQGQGMIWVQGPSGRFYTSKDFEVGKFHHSTFLAGADVNAAGTWHIDRGHITSINALSGHYKPPLEALQNAIRDLMDAGVVFTWKAVVEVYEKKIVVTHRGRKIHPEEFIKMTPVELNDFQAFPF